LQWAAVAGTVFLFLSGCGTEPPADWVWWTSADTQAVRTELAGWRQVFDANRTFTDTLRLNLSTRLSAADSTSTTGDALYKFAHLIAVWTVPAESGHADEFRFGVTVDTMALHGEPMDDTFCQVAYRDTLARTKAYFLYDSLWVVAYRPDTLPDSSVVYHVAGSGVRGYEIPQLAAKTHDWAARREVFLHKFDSIATYKVKKVSGFAAFVPSSQDAPGIDRLVLSQPGRADTFFYSPDTFGHGLYNLKPLDLLYTVQQDDPINLLVTTSTPIDTNTDKNRFFVGLGGARWEISAGARSGTTTIAFADTGYQHIYVEVMPLSNLLYRDRGYKSTIWALPVRVKVRQ
jgi:hypothetical protein